jgi:hypothetical protein
VKPEEFWAGETWAIAGKQSRLTSDVATSAVLMWVEALENAEEKLKSVSKELGSKDRELTRALTELEYLQEERTTLGLEDLDHRDLLANHYLIDGRLLTCE